MPSRVGNTRTNSPVALFCTTNVETEVNSAERSLDCACVPPLFVGSTWPAPPPQAVSNAEIAAAAKSRVYFKKKPPHPERWFRLGGRVLYPRPPGCPP